MLYEFPLKKGLYHKPQMPFGTFGITQKAAINKTDKVIATQR